jgi:uncharacterized protein YcaQ
MSPEPTVPVAAVRRLAVAAQGYASRPRRAGDEDVAAAVARLSAVQLDPISTVERSHRVVLASRAGAYDEEAVSRLLAGGRLLEYWAHEACLLPAADFPLLRAAMREGGRAAWHERHLEGREHVVDRVLALLRDQGPLTSRAIEASERDPELGKVERLVLGALWNGGVLAIAGRPGGERAFDLVERVLPADLLAAPEPSEDERLRLLVGRAVRARGVLTEAAVVEHWRLKGGVARIRPHVEALVGDGVLRRLAVDDGGPPVLVPGDAELDLPAPRTPLFLSPFDNLLWDRPLVRRLFGFEHLIEIYKPAPQRQYGYYVLPLLVGDRIVGRADLKTDRREGVLRVLALHLAARVSDAALDTALARLARAAGVATVAR